MNKIFFILLLMFITSYSFGQGTELDKLELKYLNWFNKDYDDDHLLGTSVDKLYKTILKDKTPKKTVIVAVIDGGVDIDHDDLNGKIWINEDEIPNNNIDDDKNGYIDDIYGWNFIGNEAGENIVFENAEFVRVLKLKDSSHYYFKSAEKAYNKKLTEIKLRLKNINNTALAIKTTKDLIFTATFIRVDSIDDLDAVIPSNRQIESAKKFLTEKFKRGYSPSNLLKQKVRSQQILDYHLNFNFSPREIIGDNPDDIKDTKYGNNDVIGPTSSHGTSTAGLIAAIRRNKMGINGIAENVKIMPLRVVPNGAERDKDIALSIIYAVDNGADIINMSFGKSFSLHKTFVDSAVKYAEKKGVLIIHGGGNSALNIDKNDIFPNPEYRDGGIAKNWINVGASIGAKDEQLPAIFSNYGKNKMDVFSPGVNIISLDSNNKYSLNSGTSASAPIVSGIAALILSYYPELSPEELKALIMESSNKVTYPEKVIRPNITGKKRKLIKFSKLSKSGGIVNALRAFEILEARNE